MAGFDIGRALKAVGTLGASEAFEKNPFGYKGAGADDYKRSLEAQQAAAAPYGQLIYDEEGNLRGGFDSMPTYDDLAWSDEDIARGNYTTQDHLGVWDQHQVDDLNVARTSDGLANINQGAGYYKDVLAGEGFDAVAEADYARRQQQAEQNRRAQQEAVYRDMDLRGMGGSGVEALGALTAGQGATTDMYNAGLQANALRQQNMQNAAGNLAGIGAQQQGLNDAWQQWYAGEDANRQMYNADRQWDSSTRNWDRNNYTSDANKDWWRGAQQGNRGVEQQLFNNAQDVRGGFSNAQAGVAQAHSQRGDERFDPVGMGMQVGAAALKAKAGGA